MSRLPTFSLLTLLCLLFYHFQTPTVAIEKSYIVYLGSHAHGPNPTMSDIETASTSHYELLGSVCKSVENAKEKILYSYTKSINGFAAILEEAEAAELANHPNVVSVFLNKQLELHTTQSWNFLGLEKEGFIPKSSLWRSAEFGKDVIIANVDTGVWPESKSFSDEGMAPVPSKWRGFCQKDKTRVWARVRCNRKLISVRYFNKIALLEMARLRERIDSSFHTSRDTDGHGTHTLTTAGGSFVFGANVFGLGNGTAKGGSPNARVASYKACWYMGNEGVQCAMADVMAAVDAAIHDGVDVISMSFGGKEFREFHTNGQAIAAFHAIQRGIAVISGAGNDGPTPGEVLNVAPWMITVGAATIDRQFISNVTLGNGNRLNGVSLSTNGSAAKQFYPLITGEKASNDSSYESPYTCGPGTLDREMVRGKIVVCPGEDLGKLTLESEALNAGAIGLIVTNKEDHHNKIIAYEYKIPAVDLDLVDSKLTLAYINSTVNPIARIDDTRTYLKTKPAPAVAIFSSRGPNPVDYSILKPDIIAPGVNIIASNCLGYGWKCTSPFKIASGTSMATPHVAGVVGLLKSIHPDWSPAAIQSAIITTARTMDNKKQPLLDLDTNRAATPFARGAGYINPNDAADPGLVYDLGVDDYLNYLCAYGYTQRQIRLVLYKPYPCPKSLRLVDFNYPSITVPNLNSSITFTRIVKNVGSPSTYIVRVKAPKGIQVSVKPRRLKFEEVGEAKKFQVTLKVNSKKQLQNYVFGELTWSDGKHRVTSPLIVKHPQDDEL